MLQYRPTTCLHANRVKSLTIGASKCTHYFLTHHLTGPFYVKQCDNGPKLQALR